VICGVLMMENRQTFLLLLRAGALIVLNSVRNIINSPKLID